LISLRIITEVVIKISRIVFEYSIATNLHLLDYIYIKLYTKKKKSLHGWDASIFYYKQYVFFISVTKSNPIYLQSNIRLSRATL